MIVQAKNGQKRVFKGVSFDVLATGEKSMVTKMKYKPGDFVPLHAHPNEQSGYVVLGEYRIQYGETNAVLKPGDSYCIPENVEHSFEVITGGEIIDVFTPPREDYV